MARIEIVVRDDDGTVLGGEPKRYELEVGGGTVGEIEAAVEAFKRRALPEIAGELIQQAQSEAEAEVGKKTAGNAMDGEP